MARQNQGIKQPRNRITMHESLTDGCEGARNQRNKSSFKEIGFRLDIFMFIKNVKAVEKIILCEKVIPMIT